MSDAFEYDVFLSHSAKDKAVVRELAKRLRGDGVRVWFDEWEIKPGDSIPAKIEDGLEHSRVLVLCMSAEALAADWPQLESHTFRFKDPLNHDRRFIPLRLDDAPIKGSLAQFLYINWRPNKREQEYPKLLEACRETAEADGGDHASAGEQIAERVIELNYDNTSINAYAFSPGGKRCLTAAIDKTLRLWDLATSQCAHVLECIRIPIQHIIWSGEEGRVLASTQDGKAYLIDVDADEVVVDYSKSALSKRQMDCFRLLASGARVPDMERSLDIHEITVRFHLNSLRLKLGVATRNHVRKIASQIYGSGSAFPPLRADLMWIPYLA